MMPRRAGNCYPDRVFSSRLDWNAQTNRLSALRQSKQHVLDLTASNPTRAGIEYPGEEILSALHDPRALRYDPEPRGLLSAREAVARYYGDVPASRILLTASTSEAYAYLFKLLANPGDEILAPRPSYPLFEFLAGLESVNIRQYPLRYDGVWHVDFDALEKAITPRTRGIVVVNPNNPTGSFLKRAELDRLDSLAAERGLAILSDEVFRDFGLGEEAERVSTLAGDRRALTFTMSGLSKIAGLPQMKLGWVALNGPDRGQAMDALELIADTYLSVSTPVQVALPRLLALSNSVMEQIRQRTAANLATARNYARFGRDPLAHRRRLVCSASGASNARGRGMDAQTAGRVRCPGATGIFFDFESEAFLVLSLLTPPDVFAEGLKRIIEEVL